MSVTLVTASAGTGKTHRLVEEICAALLNEAAPLPPEALVAVTFTKKAAAELAERLRRRLIGAGRIDLARRLAAARIGTVNAVCQRLVEDFSFELGLSPDLRTLDEHLAQHALSDVLASLLTGEELAIVDDLARRMPELSRFHDIVKDLVDSARLYGLDVTALRDAARKGRARLRDLLPNPVKPADELEAALSGGCEDLLRKFADVTDPDRWLARDLRRARQILHALERGLDLPWSWWLSLEFKLKAVAADHVFHPQLRDDMLKAHDLVFDVAARGLERYAESKLRWGAIDFVDQEMHALTLLSRTDLLPRLADEIRLVLVDEVQDTTPLQLQIFRALSRIAERSVWVGDRKQSIYGFRGADTSVLDVALATDITERAEPLTVSRRSRAPLVELTSRLFERAFAKRQPAVGPATLSAAESTDDPQLGAIVEWWETGPVRAELEHGDRKAATALGVARGVVALLSDDGPRVRDPHSGAIRLARAGDIAVLVRTNRSARAVAAALAKVGLRAALRRDGLGGSVEARLLRAGLCLWLDGGDRLAAAELARVLDIELSAEQLMARIADATQPITPRAAEVVDAARALRGAGLVVVVDEVMRALRLFSWCAEMDDAAQRRANLAALRALAVRHVEAAHAQGHGATVPGFVAALDDLARGDEAADGDDRLGPVDEGDAVHIVTWHGAKGLEWPIAVLAELDHVPPRSVFGRHVVQDEAGGIARRPRCWITPYWRSESRPPRGLHAVWKDAPEAQEVQARAEEEELRLLYVAWTRARDRVVLAGTADDFDKGPLALLDVRPPGRRTRWVDLDVAVVSRRLVEDPAVPRPEPPRMAYAPAPRAFTAPAFVRPSAAEARGQIVDDASLGVPLLVHRALNEDEAIALGRALHAFIAVGAQPFADEALATSILQRHGVAGTLSPTDVVMVDRRLRAFMAERMPGAELRTEVPLLHRRADGATVRGQIDLLAVSPSAVAVIDHKTYVVDAATSRTLAEGFLGQLVSYAEGVKAALGRDVDALWVHMPIAARMFRVARLPHA